MAICPFAIWYPGPPKKVNTVYPGGPPAQRHGKGLVMHSLQGSLPGGLQVLDAPASSENPRSWHFTNALDGTLFQHYDTDLQTWHATATGNPYYVGAEHENEYSAGHPTEAPFTQAQVDTDIRLIRWLAGVDAWPSFSRNGPGQTLWEHKELVQTSCPDGRVPWPAILGGLVMIQQPSLGDLDAAIISAGEFFRRTWNLGDLSEPDKDAIRWLSQQIEQPRSNLQGAVGITQLAPDWQPPILESDPPPG